MDHRLPRAIVIVGAVTMAPFMQGCGSGSVLDDHAAAKALGYEYPVVGEGNARSAFMVVDDAGGGAKRAVSRGAAAANITQTDTTADYRILADGVHDMTGLQKASGAWIDPDNNNNLALVMPVSDVDKDGKADDTFLIYTQNRPLSPSQAEYSYAYHGTRTPSDYTVGLALGRSTATYRGTAALSGTIGTTSISQAGDLEMKVDFAAVGNGVIGSVTNLTSVAGNPADYDNIRIGGDLTADRSDYAIHSMALRKGETYIEEGASTSGVGSFFGDKAGGTLGVFAHQAKVAGTNTEINLIGYLHGTTTDNK